MELIKRKKYIVRFKGCRIVKANSKKELIAKINSPDFSRAIKQAKKITTMLEQNENYSDYKRKILQDEMGGLI